MSRYRELNDGTMEVLTEEAFQAALVADPTLLTYEEGGLGTVIMNAASASAILADQAEAAEVRAAGPPAGSQPPRLQASALNVEVADNDITAVGGIYNIAAALYLDVGIYYLFFINPQPDDSFLVVASGAPCIEVTDKGVDYFVLEARDGVGGTHIDPATFTAQVFRV